MRPNDLPRRERSRNQDEVGQITDEANPGLHYFLRGESEFHRGDLGDAIQDFSTALNMREHISSSHPYAQLTVKALLMRAQCFFFLGVLDQSVRDCNEALNVSKEIGFQEGIFNAILFKIMISEVTGDVGGAFQMAVFLKTLDFKLPQKAQIGYIAGVNKSLQVACTTCIKQGRSAYIVRQAV